MLLQVALELPPLGERRLLLFVCTLHEELLGGGLLLAARHARALERGRLRELRARRVVESLNARDEELPCLACPVLGAEGRQVDAVLVLAGRAVDDVVLAACEAELVNLRRKLVGGCEGCRVCGCVSVS